jgi:hypothetical protein
MENFTLLSKREAIALDILKTLLDDSRTLEVMSARPDGCEAIIDHAVRLTDALLAKLNTPRLDPETLKKISLQPSDLRARLVQDDEG